MGNRPRVTKRAVHGHFEGDERIPPGMPSRKKADDAWTSSSQATTAIYQDKAKYAVHICQATKWSDFLEFELLVHSMRSDDRLVRWLVGSVFFQRLLFLLPNEDYFLYCREVA